MTRRLWRWLALALGTALFVWLVRDVDFARVWHTARAVPAPIWAFAVAGLAVSYALRTLRMQTELGRFAPVGFGRCLRLMLVHNLSVTLLPLRAGEAAYPLIVHRQFGLGLAQATASLVWLRMQDVIVLATLTALLWPGLPWPWRIAAVATVLVLVALLVWRARLQAASTVAHGDMRGDRRGRDAVGVRQRLRFDAFMRALGDGARHTPAGWVYTLGHWSAKLYAAALILSALAGLPIGRAAAAVLAGEWAGALPVQGPAGLGTYEASVWSVLALQPGSGDPIGAALVLHAFLLVCAGVAGLAALAVPARLLKMNDDSLLTRTSGAAR